jgi:16S rRNA (adenine(1408)-N(1))-methyltransferase
MAEVSRRAATKPARGGVENALFVQGALETLPPELDAIADRITVNYPWGSLLHAVALPDPTLLARLAALAKPRATLEVLVNLHPLRDRAYAERLGHADAAIARDHGRLRAVYHRVGFATEAIEDVTGRLIHATRWGSQLHHAKREVWFVRAVKV